MGKRLRGSRGIYGCSSPRSSSLHGSRQAFSWYENDLWTYIARFLDGKSLVMLAAVSKWFNSVIMHDSVWKFACLRDLQVLDPCHVSCSWIKLYSSAFDGSHSYMFRQPQKHIDWMRIGAFSLDSQAALLTGRLSPLTIQKEGTINEMLRSCNSVILKNIKTGIWIADLQLVRCPVCDLTTCDGTMQTLDARHIELFLSEGYQDGSWEYELIESNKIEKFMERACGAIFDLKHLKDSSTSGVFNLESWIGKSNDWQPKAVIALRAVAVNTNLQPNEGLLVKYEAMRAGPNGDVVSIRISQQLI